MPVLDQAEERSVPAAEVTEDARGLYWIIATSFGHGEVGQYRLRIETSGGSADPGVTLPPVVTPDLVAPIPGVDPREGRPMIRRPVRQPKR